MLDAFIIEEIKRRDRSDRREDRPVVELPVPTTPTGPSRSDRSPNEDRPPRGVVIIDFA